MSKGAVAIASIAAIVALLIGLWAVQQSPSADSRQFALIVGETKEDAEVGGYALVGAPITSPGPTIRVRKGDRVTITLSNVHGIYHGEKVPHNLVVVTEKEQSAEPLWGAQIGGTRYPDWIDAGRSGSVTFAPQTAGRFFYICSLPGHLGRGMYGSFVVEE
ncbi:MAG TPA: plastocyanin/azurin family copper-binding protein [bacterium]|nr:plastocyanin/azurin family copper-binding protein [bacterium]